MVDSVACPDLRWACIALSRGRDRWRGRRHRAIGLHGNHFRLVRLRLPHQRGTPGHLNRGPDQQLESMAARAKGISAASLFVVSECAVP